MEVQKYFQILTLLLSFTCLALTIVIFTIKTPVNSISNVCYSKLPKSSDEHIIKEEPKIIREIPSSPTSKYNVMDEIPITKDPPKYSCHSLKGASPEDKKRKFFIARDLLERFNQSREKALEYLYNEIGDMRKYLRSTIESALTLEQILFTLDVSIRCDLHYYPFNSFQQYHIIRAYDEISQARSKYHVMEYNPEVFYHHHRLRFTRPEIKEYIRQRDIIDMGAFCGDSMVMLCEYTDKTVYSYEYSIYNVEHIKKAISSNNIPKGKVKIVNKGVGDEVKVVSSESSGFSGSHIVEGSEGQKVNLTTLDFEAKDLNLHIGLIKGDIEGYEYKAIKGAMNVIKEQRPVISISLYHNAESFFGIPKLLKDLENYQFEMLSATLENDITMYECTYFAYPKEILKN